MFILHGLYNLFILCMAYFYPKLNVLYNRFDLNRKGAPISSFLVIGEIIISLATLVSILDEFTYMKLSILIGNLFVLIYVILAIKEGIMPFGSWTDYEKRRKDAEKMLNVKLPHIGEKYPNTEEIVNLEKVHFLDDIPFAVSVGVAYSIGEGFFEEFMKSKVTKDFFGDRLDEVITLINKLLPKGGRILDMVIDITETNDNKIKYSSIGTMRTQVFLGSDFKWPKFTFEKPL